MSSSFATSKSMIDGDWRTIVGLSGKVITEAFPEERSSRVARIALSMSGLCRVDASHALSTVSGRLVKTYVV